jgi:hypothetical protein
MHQAAKVTTAHLDMTSQINLAWAGTEFPPLPCSDGDTVLLCSDIIRIEGNVAVQPDFDVTTHVIDSALAQTRRYCAATGSCIIGFRSVEVLRMMLSGKNRSFLFLLEAALSC